MTMKKKLHQRLAREGVQKNFLVSCYNWVKIDFEVQRKACLCLG